MSYTHILLVCTVLLTPSLGRRKPGRQSVLTVSELEEGHKADCPSTYIFEEYDSLSLTSPGYPRRYPNNHNCKWTLQSSGCQFNVQCHDMYTKPSCRGDTWRPLTKCEGDYLRFYSDPLPSLTELDKKERFDLSYCWTKKANFTFGFADQMFVQFKTDKKYRARGFNCTVTCEAFDFSQLFVRIPFTQQEAVEEEEDYAEDDEDDDDDDEDDEDEDDDDEDEDVDELQLTEGFTTEDLSVTRPPSVESTPHTHIDPLHF